MTSSCFQRYITVSQDILSQVLPLSNQMSSYKIKCIRISLYVIEMPFSTLANREDPDQAALIRAA